MDGRGDTGSEHDQGMASLSQAGRWQEPETAAERQGWWLVGECRPSTKTSSSGKYFF